jgi:hypothetical protein
MHEPIIKTSDDPIQFVVLNDAANEYRRSLLIKKLSLNEERISNKINVELNKTDWLILHALNRDPFINLRNVSNEVNTSYEGVRSSLKKMYRIFNVNRGDRYVRFELLMIVREKSTDTP